MRVVVFPDRNRIEVREMATPTVRAGHVLIKTYYTSISAGTELRVLRGDLPAIARGEIRYPLVPGYENVGRVVAIGDGVVGLDEGAWVCSEGTASFREYASCWGGHAEYVLALTNDVIALPADLPPQHGLFTLLASIALHGVQRGRVALGESVVIFGQGVVGLLSLQCARLAGADRVIVVDRLPTRLQVAQHLGATATILIEDQTPRGLADALTQIQALTSNRGADVVLDATGVTEVAAVAARACRERGRLVLVGLYAQPLTFDYWDLYRREIDILPSQGAGPKEEEALARHRWTWRRTCEESLTLITARRLAVDALITHHLPIDAIADGYEALRVAPDHTLKVVLAWQ